MIHEDEAGTARPKLYWRNEQAVSSGSLLSDRPEPYEYDEEFVPRPCTVTPTRVVEYPNYDMPQDLALTLGDRFEEIDEQFGLSFFDVATTIQSKVGGYPGWTQEPNWPHCHCGRRMDHLLSITATEPCAGRWFPLDEQGPRSEDPAHWSEAEHALVDSIGHGMDMGDLGGIHLFICTTCPDLPYTHRYDC